MNTINLDSVTALEADDLKVCSQHFVTGNILLCLLKIEIITISQYNHKGKPAILEDRNNIDWLPSLCLNADVVLGVHDEIVNNLCINADDVFEVNEENATNGEEVLTTYNLPDNLKLKFDYHIE